MGVVSKGEGTVKGKERGEGGGKIGGRGEWMGSGPLY